MGNSYVLTDGRMHGSLIGNLYDDSMEIPDITNRVNRRMFSGVTEHEMSLCTSCILALQGAGKTELCKYLAYTAQQEYGKDCHTIVTNDLTIAYDEMDDSPVHVIVIDDAATNLSSMQGSEKNKAFNKWFMIRHIAEEVADSDTGKIFVFFNWQRYSTVHPNFRNPNMWFFMSPMADVKDINQVQSRIGDRGYVALKDNWDKIQDGDMILKSKSVVRIPDRDIAGGVGWYNSKYMREFKPEWNGWPKMLKAEEYGRVKEVPTVEEILDKYRNDPDYSQCVELYRDYNDGVSQVALETRYGIPQYTISRMIKKIRSKI
ncbi:MAG: hypothetical protein WCR24_07165, partial [Candidatus Methanomethylophilaceae archaeon]